MQAYNWYSILIKPTWAPPPWLFGPVWSFLYILIAISFGRVFMMALQKKIPFTVAIPFILNLIFNFIFTYIQFGLNSTLVWAMVVIYSYAKWIAYIQVPYLLWVIFATILQFTIVYLNR
ncbi:MAG: TspO and MBR like protein [Candidatus Nomurabacteria bacterium GW2011_GWC2_41_8]|uniref:TspO and MBR like protein n=1 Tax=Candidatus Nomurabacteria bacterium GW2011_GWC2_41_8 TaxID=1618755 RepID=A0A0G0XED4_9BACT|nr:MAG: TspO and MBR like protein [Candidatus Nomurabacteria bacterium GW2011_GWC2_41_8]